MTPTLEEVKAPSAKGGEAGSLERGIAASVVSFYCRGYDPKTLVAALEYVKHRSDLYAELERVRSRIGELRGQEPQQLPDERGSAGSVLGNYDELADQISRLLRDRLAETLPRSRRAEEAYIHGHFDGARDIIGKVAPDGQWVYFPIDQAEHPNDPYFLQVARVARESGRSVLEIATLYHGNSQDFRLVRLTPDRGKKEIVFKEFRRGAEALSYFVERTELVTK